MTDRRAIAMRDITRDLRGEKMREELRTSWSTAVLYRLPAIPLVWLAARVGASPIAVTTLALLLALCLPLLALVVPLAWAGLAVAITAALFQILDCVDGTLARVTGTTSRRGGELDAISDLAQWGMLYLAIGILAERTLEPGGHWAVLAMLAAWLRLLARFIRHRQREAGEPDAAHRPLRPADWPAAGVAGLSGLIPFLALAGGWLWLSVWFLVIYAVLDLLDGALPLLRTRD